MCLHILCSRKRTISTPVTSLSGSHSTSTLRRPVIRTNRQRSNTDVLTGIETAIEVTDTASATSSIPSSSTPTSVSPIGVDDTRRVVLKVALPDLASTSIMIQPELSMETVLLNICQKRKLDFDEYSLEVTKPGLVIEMDRPLGYYMNDCGISEVKVVKKEKTYSTMCVSEGGQDVMILQVIGKASKKMQVMAATPEKLIERLTDEAEQDNNFTDTILLTYRSFMSPLEFFDQLVARFNAELPPDPTPEDVEFFTKMKVPTQRRVIAAFKWWVEHHYHDFGVDGSIKADLEDFVDQIKAYNNGEFKSDALELYHLTETQNQSYEEIILNYKAVERRGKTIEGMVQEIKVEDLSQQLCIHNFKLFHNIHPIEYLNQIWKKSSESSPSMIYFIERFDKESYWAATEILREKDLKKRSSLLRKFILTAKMCADLSNFFSMFALIASLNMPVIQRLKKTWEALPEKAKKTWTELERIADPSRNMKAYRDLILAASPPIVPFLPIYLKDLIFMNDGNESRIGPDKQMINFDKLRMMANRVKDISALGSIEYSFEPKPAIQNFLAKPPIEKSMTKLKEWSLECEK
ncbi:ras guanine nucleotide exchange factor domain-containing protein [Phlyctochytrium arcticum]|nr:ras guanine nucleotide exchange factor domain-containing protein [Phlyctochytrium arcticum]